MTSGSGRTSSTFSQRVVPVAESAGVENGDSSGRSAVVDLRLAENRHERRGARATHATRRLARERGDVLHGIARRRSGERSPGDGASLGSARAHPLRALPQRQKERERGVSREPASAAFGNVDMRAVLSALHESGSPGRFGRIMGA